MKSILSITVLFAAMFVPIEGTALAASVVQEEIGMIDVVNIRDVSEEMLRDILTGELPNFAVEFTENEKLPLELFLTGDLISLESSGDAALGICFHKTVYLRCHQGTFLFSTDFIQWKPFEQFVTGMVQVRLEVESEAGPKVVFGAELLTER